MGIMFDIHYYAQGTHRPDADFANMRYGIVSVYAASTASDLEQAFDEIEAKIKAGEVSAFTHRRPFAGAIAITPLDRNFEFMAEGRIVQPMPAIANDMRTLPLFGDAA